MFERFWKKYNNAMFGKRRKDEQRISETKKIGNGNPVQESI